jgi:DNA mismatch repair protein MutS2
MSQGERVLPDGVLATIEAGTPSPLPPDQTADALETIEFPLVLDLVASRAAGPLGAERIRTRWPTDDLDWIRTELARADEVARLFRQGDGLLAEPIPDVSRALSRLRIAGSVLEGVELAAIHRVLQAARQVRADLLRVAQAAPRAAELASAPADKAIERRLELSVDIEGALLDSASPRLASARRDVQGARQRLMRKLESLLRGLEPGAAPTDATVTVRGGRYVIPVRRDSRGRPPGIIHDESGSAGTLFIEPSEAIELGNALRSAEAE